MRLTSLGMMAALVFTIAPAGCATVIGLDDGHPISDDGGDPDGAAGTEGAPLTCAANTADCNADPKDGCEATLDTPQHCGSCTNACGPGHDCNAGSCCLAANQACSKDEECCSAKCDNEKCAKPGG